MLFSKNTKIDLIEFIFVELWERAWRRGWASVIHPRGPGFDTRCNQKPRYRRLRSDLFSKSLKDSAGVCQSTKIGACLKSGGYFPVHIHLDLPRHSYNYLGSIGVLASKDARNQLLNGLGQRHKSSDWS